MKFLICFYISQSFLDIRFYVKEQLFFPHWSIKLTLHVVRCVIEIDIASIKAEKSTTDYKV